MNRDTHSYSYIWNKDIVHTIMLHLDIVTIHTMSMVNKFMDNVWKSQNFWKDKFKHDFSDVICNNNDWKNEYKSMYLAYKNAVNFTEVLKLVRTHPSVNSHIYMREHINFCDIYWLPQFDHYKTDSRTQIHFGCTSTGLQMYIYKTVANTELEIIEKITLELININDDIFIGYISKLMYKCPNIYFLDNMGSHYSFKQLCAAKKMNRMEHIRKKHWITVLSAKTIH